MAHCSGFQMMTLASREAKKKEKLERDIIEMKAQIESRNADIKAQQAEMQVAEQRITRLEANIRDQQASRSMYC